MLKNYLLTGFRNLIRNFVYSLINISGLGLGLATCLLLVLWIRHELSYDRFHEKSDRIYRPCLEFGIGGQVMRTAVSPNALLPALLTLPETETGVRVFKPAIFSPYTVRHEEKLFTEEHFLLADSTFFKVFSFRLLAGNPDRALAEPYSLVLSQSAAKKYFGDENPIGKPMQINNNTDYMVTGIVEDAPSNSILQYDLIGSFNSIRAGREEPSWWNANYQTFVVTHPHADVTALAQKTDALVKEVLESELRSEGDYVRFNFIPLTDIYLHSDFDGEKEIVSDIRYVYIFSTVAVLILVIACINYINLSTARAASRAREVGIRKVAGAVQKQLYLQFIGESCIVALCAFCLALFIAVVMLPLFNDLTGKHFTTSLLFEPKFLGWAVLLLGIMGLLAGTYPAFVLTSFKPIAVLKGHFKTSDKGIWLRKSLVVFQFGIAVILVTTTLMIVKQLDFIQSKKLGYDRENIIMLPFDGKTNSIYEALKTELLRNGMAISVSSATESPINVQAGYGINTSPDGGPGIIATGLLTDEDYIATLGMELVAGRNFTQEDRERITTDETYSFIINETALATLGLDAEDAIGHKATVGGERRGEIVGIIKDFHFSSLHTPIAPLVMFPEAQQFNKIFIRLPQGNTTENLNKVREVWKSFVSHQPFDFTFLDQQYHALYAGEQRMGKVFQVFATLAIFIACLGLLGLVLFTTTQKTREIGIRKVLGAGISHLVMLITKDFAKLVLIAIVVGLPVSWWIITNWLDNFAYKTTIGIWPVVIASVSCMVIALGTSGFLVIQAALTDPVKTLREE